MPFLIAPIRRKTKLNIYRFIYIREIAYDLRGLKEILFFRRIVRRGVLNPLAPY